MAVDPVLYRSTLIDPKTGGMTREWIRYFDQMKQTASLNKSNTFIGSNTFTKPVAISTPTGIDPSLTITAQDYQAGIELWDKQVNVGGVTPTGGSHWRWFVDNIGGGGGTVTCGFYDVANNRVAGGFDNSGIFTATQGLYIPDPSKIFIGTGWVLFPATVLGTSGASVTVSTLYDFSYFRIGKLCFVKFNLQLTVGAGLAWFNLALPFNNGAANGVSAGHVYASDSSGASWTNQYCYLGGNVFTIALESYAPWPTGVVYVQGHFFYQTT